MTTATRKITDQITYVTIERNGVSRTYYKTPSPNTRLSTAWTPALAAQPSKRISYASYVRLHVLMMDQFVSTQGKTMTCNYISRTVKLAPATEPQTAAYQAAVDNVWFEIETRARSIKSSWTFDLWGTRMDRLDYVNDLEEQIAEAIR